MILRIAAFWIVIAAVLTPALAQDWQTAESQTIRDRLILIESDGTRKTSGNARIFIAGADTSLTRNQCDLVIDVTADTTWYAPDTMNDGSTRLRGSRYDIYSIDGVDVQLEDNIWIPGALTPRASVDSTSVQAGELDGSHVKNGTLTGSDLSTSTVAKANMAPDAIGADELDDSGDFLVNSLHATTDVRADDSLSIGTSGAIGKALHYDGGGYYAALTPSASMSGNASFYWPVATGSTNGLYQKTATGAQITLSPSGLTSISATTLIGNLAASSYAASDSSYVRNLFRVGKGLHLGGWGNQGAAYWHRGGYTLSDLCPDLASGDGTFSRTLPNTQGSIYDVLQNEGSGIWGWTNAPRHASVALDDGSSNTLTISVDPLASNLAMHIDADTVATGDMFIATVSGSTITLHPKQRFIGQVSYTENTNTWEYFVISGMDAATDYSWIVHLTMQDYPTTAMRSFAGYAIHDTLAVIVPAAFTTDYILNYTIQEP